MNERFARGMMDNDSQEVLDGAMTGDTPEDVAVLYSWANLQGAKYRDFSASRREYRAAMRHKIAEEQRFAEAAAQAEAEAAAAEAERAAREAEEAARFHETAARRAAAGLHNVDRAAEEAAGERAMRHAEDMSRLAASERIEAARRAEAVAAAEAASRREAREMEEARASADRQAARYADSEHRRRELSGPQPISDIGGQISDPYSTVQPVLPGRIFHQPAVPEEDDMLPGRHTSHHAHHHRAGERLILPRVDPEHPKALVEREYLGTGDIMEDAAIAVRGTDAIVEAANRPHSPIRHLSDESPVAAESQAWGDEYGRRARTESMARAARREYRDKAAEAEEIARFSSSAVPIAVAPRASATRGDTRPLTTLFSSTAVPAMKPIHIDEPKPHSERRVHKTNGILGLDLNMDDDEPNQPVKPETVVRPVAAEAVPVSRRASRATPPASALELTPSPSQRAYVAAKAEAAARSARTVRGYAPDESSGFFAAYGSARQTIVQPAPSPTLPAWIDESSVKMEAAQPEEAPRRIPAVPSASPKAAAPAEALAHSRERVAARWYALKGVFDHGLQEMQADKDVRQGEDSPVPLVGIFSLAGGVGKTSMVATLGRSLSSTGEKVLLTDTTSHGLLPFYFGASELRPGVMRTFSPPSGSADAPICLLSYDVLQRSGDQASQEWFSSEIASKSKGMARVILDLSSNAPWVARRLARMDATMLIPLAPDMNSVISLGAMEKFFSGMQDSAGKPVEPFYVLNQFDSSMALHLDVREVLRAQLDDRLLPFVIRRSPAVPESLAEGMTVMDYAHDSVVAEDFRNLANWLKMRSAPALATPHTARWSER